MLNPPHTFLGTVHTLAKFFCDNPLCQRRVFTQQLPKLVRRYQRKTARLESVLLQLLWRVGASAALQIATLLGLIISDDSILYQFKKTPSRDDSASCPAEIGIDDFAFRKGQTYGTILIDLTTRKPIDLLPDREKATVEKWLHEHPGVRVVSRDRSQIFADAVREAAPEAVHVADRFHLLKNLMEALEQQIGKEANAIRSILLPSSPSLEDAGSVEPSRRAQRRKEETRQQRFERWQKAHELHQQGYFKKEIARMIGVDSKTIQTYLNSEVYPERQRYPPVNGALTPYKDYILNRWESGCQNALQLWREVKQQGFTGGATAVRDFVFPLRSPGMTVQVKRAERMIPTPRSLAWQLVLPERGTKKQKEVATKLCEALPVLPQCRELVVSFQDMMRRRAADELNDWLERASTSGCPSFASFSRGIRSDLAAVESAFSLEWSNGPTEGNVNRLKFVKRQGYGRASFDLLKRRVLPLQMPI
ncbi:ISL3 family transposase [Armatimonas rosea]|uniref:Transposase n=1 Tax=Armatimonas rosea TaxID=685828 RepID=A0A7W9SWF1_ARMRO|nr:ISL3 family transposase [Armatimonas rosea]MBB6054095.1 transposase [Armatimonas rosea]